MRTAIVFLASALSLGAAAPATAQTPPAPSPTIKIELKGPAPAAVSTLGAPAAAATGKAPFGCDARAPGICHFRLFYQRGSRDVVLPSGMKQAIPEVRIGQDTYCVEVNKKPIPKCARKVINAKYNN
jgi:hypothetical protein